MKLPILFYFNHDRSYDSRIRPIIADAAKEAGFDFRTQQDFDNDVGRAVLVEADVCVCHGAPRARIDDEWHRIDIEYLRRRDVRSRGGLVVVFFSRAALTDETEVVEFDDESGSRTETRYLMPIPDTEGAGFNDEASGAQPRWRRLLETFRDRQLLASWHENYPRRETNPTLDAVFLKAGDLTHLMALSILCQGYLASVAVRNDDGSWGPPEIHSALEKMGWLKLAEESPSFMGEISQRSSEQRDRVQDGMWWRDCFPGISEPTMRDAVLEEWGTDDLQGRTLVDQLIDAIWGHRELSASLLGDVYCAVASRLC